MTAADILTVSRMALSLVLLRLPLLSPKFFAVYLLCGVSDMADGCLARRTHTESERGAKLDSAADLLFAAVCFAKLLPLLDFPIWLWLWIGGIAVLCLANLAEVCRNRNMAAHHTPANKLTGLALFVYPFFLQKLSPPLTAIPLCLLATFAAAEERLFRGRKSKSR